LDGLVVLILVRPVRSLILIAIAALTLFLISGLALRALRDPILRFFSGSSGLLNRTGIADLLLSLERWRARRLLSQFENNPPWHDEPTKLRIRLTEAPVANPGAPNSAAVLPLALEARSISLHAGTGVEVRRAAYDGLVDRLIALYGTVSA